MVNLETRRLQQRNGYNRWTLKHPDEAKEKNRLFRLTHPNYPKEWYQKNKGLIKEKKEVYLYGQLRSVVLERDGYKCVRCKMTDKEHREKWGCSITIDHIDGNGYYKRKSHKNNLLENLQTLCLKCHGKKDCNPAVPLSHAKGG